MYRRVLPFLASFLIPGFLSAQTVPPVSENVVVSAGLSPETAPAISAAVTVITRDEIEKSGRTSVADLLREVPGVDVVESGGAGTVTSVFLRGANSNHTLVLIDGVRMNDPNSGGYDFSALSAENIERIEVARGPFSALYGSDAIGGVISIFTRPVSKSPTVRVSAAGGNAAFHEESLFASGGAGDFSLSVAGRDVRDGGDATSVAGTPVDNSAWHDENGSAHLQWKPSESFDAGLEVARMFARTGIPSDGSVATPDNFSDLAQTTWTLPVHWQSSDSNSLSGSVSSVESRPYFFGPEGLFPDTSRVHTRTLGARLSDTWNIAGQAISIAGSYEESKVNTSDDFGPEIVDREIHTDGVAIEDRISLLNGRLAAVAGVRYDRNSPFGSSTNPRISLIYSPTSSDAVRASFGTAFHAPTINDLYYPFFGNPDLLPEKSRNYEIGYTRRAGAAQVDVSLFRSDIRDLIQYDFVTSGSANIGRARTRGIETGVSYPVSSSLLARVSYAYLEATDLDTGQSLVRRPTHRGSLDLAWNDGPWTADGSAIFTGRRTDVDSSTFERIEDPSYLRYDISASYRLDGITPFVRVKNLTDRRYAEINGYPAPGRRIEAGIMASF